MLKIKELKKYYNGKKVLITGHTGFKGSYMCVLLKYLGAKVYGYSLKPEKGSLYELLTSGLKQNVSKRKTSLSLKVKKASAIVEDEVFADIRDLKKITSYVEKIKPDYVLHMAAQPLVLRGYKEPQYTYEVNVMGTVNILEAVRRFTDKSKRSNPISILNVTTDKVYENNDLSNYAFKEHDKLCGFDPYANSKSCSELVTYSYAKSFFADKSLYRVSTARAGNVIGGGDLNENRIIPDCFRAIKNKKDMTIRNPHSIRPYQYVLEPLIMYLNIMALQRENEKYEGNFNIGPDKKNCLTTKKLCELFFKAWEDEGSKSKLIKCDNPNDLINEKTDRYNLYKKYNNTKIIISKKNKKSPHESEFLRLDNSLIKKLFSYKEIFDMEDTMRYTASVYYDILGKKNIYESILNIIETLS